MRFPLPPPKKADKACKTVVCTAHLPWWSLFPVFSPVPAFVSPNLSEVISMVLMFVNFIREIDGVL